MSGRRLARRAAYALLLTTLALSTARALARSAASVGARLVARSRSRAFGRRKVGIVSAWFDVEYRHPGIVGQPIVSIGESNPKVLHA